LPEARLMTHTRTETKEERLVRLIVEALDLARSVPLHADLTILARLSCALARARAAPIAT
jgi:hypothetical protein